MVAGAGLPSLLFGRRRCTVLRRAIVRLQDCRTVEFRGQRCRVDRTCRDRRRDLDHRCSQPHHQPDRRLSLFLAGVRQAGLVCSSRTRRDNRTRRRRGGSTGHRRTRGGFFRVRFDRTTDAERAYLEAMASVGGTEVASGAVADALGKTTTGVAQTRDALIRRGLCYSPRHGVIAFTVPMFDQYLRRRTERVQ